MNEPLVEFNLKKFLFFSFPITLQILLKNLIGFTDNFMVGNLGPEYMAALTIATRYFSFLLILFWAFSQGASIIASQLWGKKDFSGFKKSISVTISLTIFVSFLLSLIIYFGKNLGAVFMINDKNVIIYINEYLGIMSLTFFVTCLNLSLSIAFTSSGDTKTPFYQQLIITILNVILNYLLIFGKFGFPELKVKGAAIASLISTISGTILLIIIGIKKKKLPDIKDIIILKLEPLKDIIKISLPILFDMFLWQFAGMVYMKIIGTIGKDSVAIYGIVGTFFPILYLAISGFVQGTSINVSQLIGAGLPKKAYIFTRKSLFYSIIFGLVPSIILIFFSPIIPYYFKIEKEYFNACTISLIILGLRQVFVTSTAIFASVIRAGKDTLFIPIISFSGFLFVGLPLMLIVTYFIKIGIVGIFIALSIEEIAKSIMFYYRYKTKKWLFKSYDNSIYLRVKEITNPVI